MVEFEKREIGQDPEVRKDGRAKRTHAEKVQLKVKRLEALRLRRAGIDYQVIADRLGYANRSAAYNAIMAELHTVTVEASPDVMAMELSRLDHLLTAMWTQAIQGNQGAVDRCLKIMERRAALMGLDAPQRVDITNQIREIAVQNGLDPDQAVEEAKRIIADLKYAEKHLKP